MGFENVTLADIQLDKPSALPFGEYVFDLLPGTEVRVNKFGGEELNVSAAVVEGDYKGRRVFWNYPDPTSVSKEGKPKTWSGQAMKKLEIALGIDSLPGEASKDYFNRVAMNGQGRFAASIVPENKIRAGETEPRPTFGIFTVKPAA